MKKQTILVTGGAGFIGSHVNKLLHEAGYDTVVLDNLTSGSYENIKYGDFVRGDIGSAKDLDELFSSYTIDVVMHFAAYIDVGESVKAPALYYKNNVVNTLTLLDKMLQHRVTSIVFSSSAAVYGYPVENFITESHPENPINPYGETKLVIDRLLRDYHHAYGLNYCSLRYFNAAGGDPTGILKNHNHQKNLIPATLRSLKSPEGRVTIYGTDYPTKDGTGIRDYIHVMDLAEAHLLGLNKLLEGNFAGTYNLGNGNGFSVREVIKTVEEVTGKKVHAIEGPRREGDPAILLADSRKARNELGWKPQYSSLEKIVADAWNALDYTKAYSTRLE